MTSHFFFPSLIEDSIAWRPKIWNKVKIAKRLFEFNPMPIPTAKICFFKYEIWISIDLRNRIAILYREKLIFLKLKYQFFGQIFSFLFHSSFYKYSLFLCMCHSVHFFSIFYLFSMIFFSFNLWMYIWVYIVYMFSNITNPIQQNICCSQGKVHKLSRL